MKCELYKGTSVSWEKDMKKISSTTDTGVVIMTHIERGKLTSILEKSSVTKEDAGLYSCQPDEEPANKGYNAQVFVFKRE